MWVDDPQRLTWFDPVDRQSGVPLQMPLAIAKWRELDSIGLGGKSLNP